MKKFDLYIIKKYFTTFILSMFLLILVVIVFDLSEKLDKFLVDNITLKEILFDYYANFIPYFFNLFLYLFVFISVIFFSSKLAQNSEFIAVSSAGISFYRVMRPYIYCAVVLAFVAFLLSNFVIPKSNVKLTDFENKYLRKSNKYSTYAYDIHVQVGENEYIFIKDYTAKKNEGTNFTYEKLNFQDGLTYKLNARSIKLDTINNVWIASDYVERQIFDDNEILSEGDTKELDINLQPKDLVFFSYDIKNMNMRQLNEFIADEKKKGVRSIVEYEVEKHLRISNSFATILLSILGFSLSYRKKRSGLGWNLGFGVTLTFLYVLLMQVTKVFAINKSLDPMLAAWVPNIFFTIVTIIVVKMTPK